METLPVALAVVFVAELGDKTQLVAVSLATRHRASIVLVGILVAFAVTQGLAAIVGGLLGATLPETTVGFGAALAFLGFAAWTWFDVDDDDGGGELVASARGGLRALAGVIIAMSVAEMGDKTMLATTTLAADRDPFLTWIGAALGGTAAAALGVVVGRLVGARLPERITKRVAAALFAVFGVLLLVDTLR